MMLMHESTPDMVDQEASVVPGEVAYLHDLEAPPGPLFRAHRASPAGDGLSAGAAESG
jgi:hypothetical protein